ncbi:hypothetical protein Taro_027975 [Colocasia esculenta]|uniref:Retrotransposon gag domain-containing protein n=1 Tax=Colocasia esculenta TaxID=4460 RepID=A0A843VLQ0_COLES|nr:hypothetical protein [Colocasia esculenta]
MVLEASVLRWCRPARAGDVFVPFGARRRRPFLREGPNGFVLHVEGLLRNPPLSVIATIVEVAIWSRRPGRSRQDRNALGCRNPVATARAVATGSRQGRASRPGRDGPMRRNLSSETGETSQQRQGVRRAEETGRYDMAPHRHNQARQLVEQQDESAMPAQGQVQEEVSADESMAQPQVEPEVEQPERQQRSGTGSTQAGRRRTVVTEDRTALLERFLHLRPPMFHGEYDPDKAESWTHELERIFETMECAEEDQVRLAVYQLKGAAHEWWRVQRQTHFQGQRLDHITWQRFSEVFYGEYFPDYARRERRDQFHALVQDDLTVSQYHQRCTHVNATWSSVAIAFPVFEVLTSFLGSRQRRPWCRPARAGDVFVPFGARRRRPFLREGPNGFVLRMEVGTLDPLALSQLPSPSKAWSDFSAAAGRTSGGGDGAVVGVPVASSGSPFSVYVTLGVCP